MNLPHQMDIHAGKIFPFARTAEGGLLKKIRIRS
jgi:hypothetical protein